MTATMRLRQSIAKNLLTMCPAIARQRIDDGSDETNLMRKGSLLDQLVFNQPNFHVVEARLKSGPDKGQIAKTWQCAEAREQREAARERGQVACFQHELEAASSLAGLVRARLLEAGAELRDDSCPRQLTIRWNTELGIEAEGTPDLIILFGDPAKPVRVDTVDLKRTDPNPEWLQRQVDNQHWDLQGFAYQEAVHKQWPSAQGRGRHWILAADEKHRMVQMHWLDPVFMACGKTKWEKAQAIWTQCLEADEWPEYPSVGLTPAEYTMKKHLLREAAQ